MIYYSTIFSWFNIYILRRVYKLHRVEEDVLFSWNEMKVVCYLWRILCEVHYDDISSIFIKRKYFIFNWIWIYLYQ